MSYGNTTEQLLTGRDKNSGQGMIKFYKQKHHVVGLGGIFTNVLFEACLMFGSYYATSKMIPKNLLRKIKNNF